LGNPTVRTPNSLNSNSSGKILLRALFDPETGKTFLRHPSSEMENEWVETSLLKDLKTGKVDPFFRRCCPSRILNPALRTSFR
jgi:hypothetical protein